ncbi:MAG: 2-amino-4-hydroxy-6-hydroxymethyldihydropteridine diphosphokinase [Weeksellaceae bacterium]
MTLHTTILLLGSDLGDRNKSINDAKSFINKEIGSVKKESNILETKSIGFTSDQNFLNQTLVVQTKLSPMQLLRALKDIEKRMGRVYMTPKPGEMYTSRIIDLDILYYDKINFKSKYLLIPHPQVYTRPFVTNLLNDISL